MELYSSIVLLSQMIVFLILIEAGWNKKFRVGFSRMQLNERGIRFCRAMAVMVGILLIINIGIIGFTDFKMPN